MTDTERTPTVFEFNGRRFRALRQATVEHDFWIMKRVRAAGLDSIEHRKGEDAEGFARRLLFEIVEQGVVFELLSGVLIPVELEDTDWTPEIAAQTAAHLRTVTEPAEKTNINTQLTALVMGFFAQGLISVTISRSSLSELEAGARPEAGAGADRPVPNAH